MSLQLMTFLTLPLLSIRCWVFNLGQVTAGGSSGFLFALRQSGGRCLWLEGKRTLTSALKPGSFCAVAGVARCFTQLCEQSGIAFFARLQAVNHCNSILRRDLHCAPLKGKAVAVLPSDQHSLELLQLIKGFLLCNSLPRLRDFSFLMKSPIIPFLDVCPEMGDKPFPVRLHG